MDNPNVRDVAAREALRRALSAQVEIIRTLDSVQFKKDESDIAIEHLNKAVDEIRLALNVLLRDETR